MPLDPGPEQMRSMAAAVTEALVGLDRRLGRCAGGRHGGGARRRAAPGCGAARGRHAATSDASLEEALEAARRTFEYSGPGYLAYIPGGGLYTAALAEFLAQGLNRYVGLWQPSPAVVQIEENVTRWLCGLFDFPAATAQGVLTSGGSLANLSAVVTARHSKLGRGLPRRHVLRDRPGARLEHEGGDDRRVRCARRAPGRAHRRRAPDGCLRRSRAWCAPIAPPGGGRSW